MTSQEMFWFHISRIDYWKSKEGDYSSVIQQEIKNIVNLIKLRESKH